MGGGPKTLDCPAPLIRTPPTGRYPCPGPFLPTRARFPRVTLSPSRIRESPLYSEPNPHPSRIPQSHQGPGKPPTRQGQTSQLLAGPRSASCSPHAKLVKIGFLQSPGAHSKPHAPPHHSPSSEGRERACGWEEEKGKQINPNYPNRNPQPRGEASSRGRGRVAGSREKSEPAGARGGGRAGPSSPAALTSALSDGLSTAIFCHGSASCASGIFPPGPPPSPPPPSPPAPRPAPFRRRPSPTAEAAAAAAAATAAARERARRRHRPSNAARPAGDARALSESLARLPGTGSRPFLPLLLPPPGLQLRPPRRFPRPLPAEQRPPRAPPLPLTTWRLSDTCLSERGSAAAATAARSRGRGLGRHAPGRGAPLVPPSSPELQLLGLAFFQEGQAEKSGGVGGRWGKERERRRCERLRVSKSHRFKQVEGSQGCRELWSPPI